MPDLRVLCLHGYHGTGAILRRQMAPLAGALLADIEFVYVDAPSLAAGGFGWWHEGFSGWEHTRDWIAGRLSAGPRIDGLFGFSQGAALTGLLAALRESPRAPHGLASDSPSWSADSPASYPSTPACSRARLRSPPCT
jgi:Serine hydrolase (FSH1)